MPTSTIDFTSCVPSKEIQLKFALLPVNDVHGKRIWFRMYWDYTGVCELGVYSVRGKLKDYRTKYEFWKSISYGVMALRRIMK